MERLKSLEEAYWNGIRGYQLVALRDFETHGYRVQEGARSGFLLYTMLSDSLENDKTWLDRRSAILTGYELKDTLLVNSKIMAFDYDFSRTHRYVETILVNCKIANSFIRGNVLFKDSDIASSIIESEREPMVLKGYERVFKWHLAHLKDLNYTPKMTNLATCVNGIKSQFNRQRRNLRDEEIWFQNRKEICNGTN